MSSRRKRASFVATRSRCKPMARLRARWRPFSHMVRASNFPEFRRSIRSHWSEPMIQIPVTASVVAVRPRMIRSLGGHDFFSGRLAGSITESWEFPWLPEFWLAHTAGSKAGRRFPGPWLSGKDPAHCTPSKGSLRIEGYKSCDDESAVLSEVSEASVPEILQLTLQFFHPGPETGVRGHYLEVGPAPGLPVRIERR